MAKVIISSALEEEINKVFKKESITVFEAMRDLEANPHKRKPLGQINGIAIKEIKYGSFRFYFIVEGYKLRVFSVSELKDLIIHFVRMSGKKDQQDTINDIKDILRKIGVEGFD